MPILTRCPLPMAACLLVATNAIAQVPAPPIKPGLWQVQSGSSVDGKPMPDMSERMKSLPPEARKQMEAMMKQRGVDTSGGGTRICMARETIDSGRWQDPGPRCSFEVTSRSASAWKWRSACTEPPSTSEGEAVFHGPESYTVTNTSTVTRKGKAHSSTHVAKMKWLGADCGDLKPMQIPKR
jgi:Protein of unknown function (DUF3617)